MEMPLSVLCSISTNDHEISIYYVAVTMKEVAIHMLRAQPNQHYE